MTPFYQMTPQELQQHFGTSENGLSREAAKQLLKEKGENVLKEGKQKSVLQVFAEQFRDLLVLILVAAAVISMFSGNMESTLVIFVVIILNAVLGTLQYVKARKSLDSLKALASPHARVIRDGEKMEILSKEVVPGDLLLLEAGDMAAADGRILESFSLQVNESSLTGESANVDKSDKVIMEEVSLGDRTNMVFSGSLVTYGRAVVLVTATGMETEIGRIADLMNTAQEKRTPLQISLDHFSKKLAMVILVVCGIVFLLSIYRKMPLLDSLMFAVALAVAAIPEALSSIVTIVQAMGTRKMAAEHAIIKELKAVESLGCVSVICSDKTGTLTQNKMTVQHVYLDGKTICPEDIDLKEPLHRYLLYNAILNNDSTISQGRGIGDPTEFCLLEMARKAGLEQAGISEQDIREMMHRMGEIPFDSERKRMSTKYQLHGIPTVLTKGAVDVLLERTVSIMESGKAGVTTEAGEAGAEFHETDETGENGKSGSATGGKNARVCPRVRPMTEADKVAILKKNQEFSENGLRVLAFVYKEVDESEALSTENEQGYTFIGLVSMMDPPREESEAAVADARKAGIKTVMITGDHKITAAAIARKIGILEEEAGDLAITGAELDAMNEKELDQKLENISVYARVSPENKIRIVEAWQRKGRITAMTGDGVNDAPALKKADIGVAMGITGTEVSKDAAAMILTDDNFATIIKAVLNGRNVYRNIKNAIQFLLSGNMAGILVVLYCSLMALPTPFAPVQLLFMNLVTDSLPALAIGMEPSDRRLLELKPRDPRTGILTREFMRKLLLQGGLIAIAALIAFYTGLKNSSQTACTMAFAVLTLARLFHGFNCRSEQPILKIGFWSNPFSIGAFLAGVLLLNAVLFIPLLQRLFSVSMLRIWQILWIYILAIFPTLVIQGVRMVNTEVYQHVRRK